MDYRTLLPQIDACRPGSDDRNDPELADLAAHLAADPQAQELYDRVQVLDARIAAQFAEAPVPAGLAERLLAGLSSATTATVEESEQAEVYGPVQPASAAPAPPALDRPSRRWLQRTAAGLAIAASLAIAIFALRPAAPFTPETIIDGTLAYQMSGLPEIELQAGDASQPPAGLHASKLLTSRIRVLSSRPAPDFLGSSAVAHELRVGRVKATLYVARIKAQGLPSGPPPVPTANTGGYSISTWQEGDLLYVLVVRGGEEQYRRFVEEPRGSVA